MESELSDELYESLKSTLLKASILSRSLAAEIVDNVSFDEDFSELTDLQREKILGFAGRIRDAFRKK